MDNFQNISNQEDLWGAILSEDEKEILSIKETISIDDLEIITNHLIKMSTETGWHPSQKRSASFALNILKKQIE